MQVLSSYEEKAYKKGRLCILQLFRPVNLICNHHVEREFANVGYIGLRAHYACAVRVPAIISNIILNIVNTQPNYRYIKRNNLFQSSTKSKKEKEKSRSKNVENEIVFIL